MVHRLAADDDVVVAEPPEQLVREFAVADLGLLQAEDVGRFLGQEFLDDRRARARTELMFQEAIFRDEDMGAGLAERRGEGGLRNGKAPAPGAWSEGHQALLREVNCGAPVRATGGKPEADIRNCSLGFRTVRPVAQMNESWPSRSAARPAPRVGCDS